MKKCKDIVYSLLENNPSLRDCDVKLMCAVWKKQSGLGYYFSEKPISLLFDLMLEKKISSAESIRRSRAKLQELHKHLRGDMYEKRHKLQKDTLYDLDTMSAEGTGVGY